MALSTVDGDLLVKGILSPTGGVRLPATATPFEQKFLSSQGRSTYQQNGNAADETVILRVVAGATGTIKQFGAACITAPVGAATCTFMLKKNGTDCLSGVITLNSSSTAYVVQTGTLSVTSVVAGDVLTVVIDETTGGGTKPTGVGCYVVVNEDNLT